MYAGNRDDNARLMTAEQAQGYTGMGKTVFRQWADKIGATRKMSAHLVRYDRKVIDAALDAMRHDTQNNV